MNEHKALTNAHRSTEEMVINHRIAAGGEEMITTHSEQLLPT